MSKVMGDAMRFQGMVIIMLLCGCEDSRKVVRDPLVGQVNRTASVGQDTQESQEKLTQVTSPASQGPAGFMMPVLPGNSPDLSSIEGLYEMKSSGSVTKCGTTTSTGSPADSSVFVRARNTFGIEMPYDKTQTRPSIVTIKNVYRSGEFEVIQQITLSSYTKKKTMKGTIDREKWSGTTVTTWKKDTEDCVMTETWQGKRAF